ncbi:MAG: hypothetical protein QOD26_3071 [Betaproteobacteria bacterium]|jgi:hypothetical protein|nr:hypothetical protein [Betaproteobacteria bacterium]
MKARWIRLGALAQRQFDAACAAIAAAQLSSAAPILLWSEEAARYPFALIAPRKFAPGREKRWHSWGLASAVATYRQFGVPAYLDDELRLHGRDIAQTRVEARGECAVVTSSFLMRFPGSCVATPSRELEEAFRLRLEAQHGWQFDHSWPDAHERLAYASPDADAPRLA